MGWSNGDGFGVVVEEGGCGGSDLVGVVEEGGWGVRFGGVMEDGCGWCLWRKCEAFGRGASGKFQGVAVAEQGLVVSDGRGWGFESNPMGKGV